MIDTATYNNFMAANPGLTPEARDYANMAGTGPDVVSAPTGYVNPNSNYFSQPSTKPVTILSSSAGQDILNKNTEKLKGIESGYMGPSIIDYKNSLGQSSDFASRKKEAESLGIKNYTGTSEQNTQYLQTLRNISSSPISKSMVDDINKMATNDMTPEDRTRLNNLTSAQDDVTTATAKARAALEAKDYKSMDYWTALAEKNKLKYENDLAEYYKSTKELRDKLAVANTPTGREMELKKEINNIRSQAEQFDLQTQADKLSEYEGQTLGFAGGRAAQIDRKASLKRQEFALKEKNLLLSLGLEQEARKMSEESLKLGLSYLKDDFELQQKVQEKIDEEEDELVNKAEKLQTIAKDNLIKLLDELEGINPESLSEESITKLESLATNGGIPFDLVLSALKVQHDKRVFDDSLKLAQENRLGKDKDKSLSILDVQRYQDLYPDAGVISGDSEESANQKVQKSTSPEVKLRRTIEGFKDDGNSYDKVIEDIETSTSIDDKETAKKIADEVYGMQSDEGINEPVYGTGNFVNVDIRERIDQLLKVRGLTDSDIKNQLIQDGYPQGVVMSLVGNWFDKTIDSISSFLFR